MPAPLWLAEGPRNPVVCREDRIRELVPQRLLSVREAIHAALTKVTTGEVETSWSMAGLRLADLWLLTRPISESPMIHPNLARHFPERHIRKMDEYACHPGIAYAHFVRVCPLMSATRTAYRLSMVTAINRTEHDAILQALQSYIDGCKQGKSSLMRPTFHPQASFIGYVGDQLVVGVDYLFDWIDRNGPAPDIEPRVVSVEIADSIAVVRLEVANWSGKLAGSGVRMSDLFTFLRTPEGWKIIQKAFHWHS